MEKWNFNMVFLLDGSSTCHLKVFGKLYLYLVRKCEICFTERKHKFKFNYNTIGRWNKYIQGKKQKF